MKENSHILHCYDNLVTMATANNCIFMEVCNCENSKFGFLQHLELQLALT